MSRRTDRINVLMRQELSGLISREIKDPRVSGIITITQVDTSSDMRNARVYLSVMGDSDTKREALDGLRSASSFLRRELRTKISLRYIPFLSFELDDTLEHSINILNILDTIKPNDPPSEPSQSIL
ncbi:MAG: ribosome-binding factor A [Dehalococcoidia bacterium]|nr:ribosome-binding factor A [Dehalococcoidia bacterium]